MSKFNHIAKEFDRIAREALSKHVDATERLRAAEKAFADVPQPSSGLASSADIAKRARLEADFIERKEAYRRSKDDLTGKYANQIQKLRDRLLSEIDDTIYASPDNVDLAALELMKAGVMNAGDFDRLMSKAIADNNIAMVRLAAKYATEAAEKQHDVDPAKTAQLRRVASRTRECDGTEQVKAFDYLLDVYTRSVYNPAMVNHWEGLTQNVVEAF